MATVEFGLNAGTFQSTGFAVGCSCCGCPTCSECTGIFDPPLTCQMQISADAASVVSNLPCPDNYCFQFYGPTFTLTMISGGSDCQWSALFITTIACDDELFVPPPMDDIAGTHQFLLHIVTDGPAYPTPNKYWQLDLICLETTPETILGTWTATFSCSGFPVELSGAFVDSLLCENSVDIFILEKIFP